MHLAFMNYLGHFPFSSRYCRLYTLVAHCSVHVVGNIFYIYFAVAYPDVILEILTNWPFRYAGLVIQNQSVTHV